MDRQEGRELIGPGSYVDDFRHGFHFYGRVLAKKAPPGVVRVRWADGTKSFVPINRLQRLSHRPRQRVGVIVGFDSSGTVEPFGEVLIESNPVGHRILVSDFQRGAGCDIADFLVLGAKNGVSWGPVAPGLFDYRPQVRASERMSLRLRNRQPTPVTLHASITGFYEQAP